MAPTRGRPNNGRITRGHLAYSNCIYAFTLRSKATAQAHVLSDQSCARS